MRRRLIVWGGLVISTEISAYLALRVNQRIPAQGFVILIGATFVVWGLLLESLQPANGPTPTEDGGSDRRETGSSDSSRSRSRPLSRRPLFSRSRLRPLRRRRRRAS